MQWVLSGTVFLAFGAFFLLWGTLWIPICLSARGEVGDWQRYSFENPTYCGNDLQCAIGSFRKELSFCLFFYTVGAALCWYGTSLINASYM